MRRRSAVCLVLAALVATTNLPAAAQGPIRIGASLSLTGTYAKLGKNQHEGYQLCIKELNAKGGLLGRKVGCLAESPLCRSIENQKTLKS